MLEILVGNNAASTFVLGHLLRVIVNLDDRKMGIRLLISCFRVGMVIGFRRS